MKKLTITYLGTPKEITTKYGPKQKNSIKAKEYAENYLSFWVNAQTQSWKVGGEIEVEDVTTREYNGKTYYDIIMPKFQQNNMKVEFMALSTKIDQLSAQNRRIIDHLSGKNPLNVTSNGTKVPDFSEVDEAPPLEENW